MKKASAPHELRAAKAWTALANLAASGRTVTYEDLGRAVGCHRRVLRWPLALIQDHCLQEKLPPLSLLAVEQLTGRPSSGFSAWDIDDFDEGLRRVQEHDWSGERNPFAYALRGHTEEQLVQLLITAPRRSKEVYALILTRGVAQRLFRSALMAAYGRACAFCGLTFPEALEGAHILPWHKSNHEQRLDVRNGLLLCATHHRLFDVGWLRVAPNLKIEHQEASGRYAPSDVQATRSLAGSSIRLPRNRELWPNAAFLRDRNALVK